MMIMRKSLLWIAALAIVAAGCAKPVKTGLNEANKEYLQAWMLTHYPGVNANADGLYIIEDHAGTGALIGEPDVTPYLRVNYTVQDLSENITITTLPKIAQQIGTYSESNFYGPELWTRLENGLLVGANRAVSDMRIGGSRRVVIPGWLLSSKTFGTVEYCYENATGVNAIYTIDVVEGISDIVKWEIDSLSSYIKHNVKSVSPADSVKYGYYYKQTKAPTKPDKSFAKDTTVSINYIGRLLDGTVFDTTIKDTAKFYGIYSASKTYAPTKVNMKEEYGKATFASSGSTMIDGFAYTISLMHPGEKGSGIFYSKYGYGTKGSGATIPAYSPLCFDIEIVE